MDVLTALKDRQSVRAFLPTSVPKSLVASILDAARFAPSGVNTQPWKVVVLSKAQQQAIGDTIIGLRDKGVPENPDYAYYPKQWVSPYLERRKACGLALYGALNISLENKEARKTQWYRNYHFFGAPRGLLFFIDRNLDKGSWLDMGMFLQNVMIAARGFGLETCPEASLAEYPDAVRQIVGVSSDFILICGMALGYADWDHPINRYRTTREPVDSFTTWPDGEE